MSERDCFNCAHGRKRDTYVTCNSPCTDGVFENWQAAAGASEPRQEPAGAPNAGAAIPAQQDEGVSACTGRAHAHYFKDVRGLQTVDVYRVLRLFGVTDPCIQHALKKLLVAGGRGVKDQAKDVQEAIDTLTRWQEMRAEDEGRN